jgi:hypothetical protein
LANRRLLIGQFSGDIMWIDVFAHGWIPKLWRLLGNRVLRHKPPRV